MPLVVEAAEGKVTSLMTTAACVTLQAFEKFLDSEPKTLSTYPSRTTSLSYLSVCFLITPRSKSSSRSEEVFRSAMSSPISQQTRRSFSRQVFHPTHSLIAEWSLERPKSLRSSTRAICSTKSVRHIQSTASPSPVIRSAVAFQFSSLPYCAKSTQT